MKRGRSAAFLLVVWLLMMQTAEAQEIDYLSPTPMSQVVKVRVRPVATGTVKVPLITWGGDVATILADMNGIFREEGLSVSLFREDNFAKQVEMCLSGETPYLRGTMGMVNAAADAFKAHNVEMVVLYQLTWSTGQVGHFDLNLGAGTRRDCTPSAP